MIKDTEGTPKQLQARGQSSFVGMSFEQAIEDEIAKLEELGINPLSTYVYPPVTPIFLPAQYNVMVSFALLI